MMGRHSPRNDYKTKREGIFEKGKLAILVDESSASASEVLAGAVQDWDRGIVVGRRSYGKGLVQEQYEMNDGAALRLTIARYYTPSGRSIQRSYAGGKEAYAEDFAERFHTGELTGNDTARLADTMRYYTSRKRAVFGGGGITPDVYVPYDTIKLNSALLNLIYNEDTKNFLWDYFLSHRSSLKEYKSADDFYAKYNAADIIDKLAKSLPANLQKSYQAIVLKSRSKEYLELQLKAQLARFMFRNNGYYAIAAKGDEVIQQALKALYGNSYLTITGR